MNEAMSSDIFNSLKVDAQTYCEVPPEHVIRYLHYYRPGAIANTTAENGTITKLNKMPLSLL